MRDAAALGGQDLPRSLRPNLGPCSRLVVRVATSLLLAPSFLSGGHLIELDKTKKSYAHADRDVIPSDLAPAKSLAQTLREPRAPARVCGKVAHCTWCSKRRSRLRAAPCDACEELISTDGIRRAHGRRPSLASHGMARANAQRGHCDLCLSPPKLDCG